MTREEIKYQWLSLPEWQRILIVSIIFVVLVYLMYFFFISPKREKISSLNKDVAKLQKEVEKLRNTVKPEEFRKLNQKFLRVKNEIRKTKEELKLVEAKIPTSPELETLVLYLSNTFKNNNLFIEDFGITKEKILYAYKEGDKLILEEKKKKKKVSKKKRGKEEKKKEKVKIHELSIFVQTSGNIKNLKSTLDDISNSKRFITVEGLSLEKGKNGALKTRINMKTYYIPEKKR